jgi:hypothetical protein
MGVDRDMTSGKSGSVAASPGKGRAPIANAQIGFHHRDAVRLLFILALGSERRDPQDNSPEAGRVFRGEKRAMAMDFLVRYPDYLADELLNHFDKEHDPEALKAAERIFDANEPDIRTVAMVRWRRGAFQNIEMPLSILRAKGLVRPMRQTAGQRRHDFEIEPTAYEFMDRIVREQPALAWYRERVELVMTLAGFRSGSSLKDEQYLHDEYRNAPHGTEIPSIKERVLARLNRMKGAQ